MEKITNISVVLPSLDPDEKLLAVIDGLLEYGFSDIILINDGSKPENIHYFETAATHPEVHLLHHPENKGKGAALKTAFRWFLENRPDYAGVVTVDGDNQHHPEDTRRCAEHMLKTGRQTLGVRDFSQKDVPARSRSGNRITSFIFKIFVGMTISDTQTGLRAIPTADIRALLPIAGERFEYETNMLLSMKTLDIPFDEVKIRTVYIEENKSSHFRAVRDSWRIYKLILSHFFRYTASSLISSVVETSLYALLTDVFADLVADNLLTAAAFVPSRVLSSVLNYLVNRKLVFHSHASLGRSMTRYFTLMLGQMAVQWALDEAAYVLLAVAPEATALRTVIHVVIMMILFFISYIIQQRWVFRSKKTSNIQ